ncbi:MAG: hypothetical protein ABF330_00435 [Lentimonas sp.]
MPSAPAPAAPRPATPRPAAQPTPSFEELAEGDGSANDSPSIAGVALDAIVAAVAIAFIALLLKDVLPFLS